jgi:hypothetical protein
MTTDTIDFTEIESILNQVNPDEVTKMVAEENMPPFIVREQFRPVLLKFFNLMTGQSGSYVTAERLTKEYFEQMGIPQSAWNYRNRKPN